MRSITMIYCNDGCISMFYLPVSNDLWEVSVWSIATLEKRQLTSGTN